MGFLILALICSAAALAVPHVASVASAPLCSPACAAPLVCVNPHRKPARCVDPSTLESIETTIAKRNAADSNEASQRRPRQGLLCQSYDAALMAQFPLRLFEHIGVNDTFDGPMTTPGTQEFFHNPMYDSTNTFVVGTNLGSCVRTVKGFNCNFSVDVVINGQPWFLYWQGPNLADSLEDPGVWQGFSGKSYFAGYGRAFVHPQPEPRPPIVEFIFYLPGQ